MLALIHPPLFTWFGSREIVWGLAVIMLGMGITLSVDDFKGVLKMPRAVAAGFAAQYFIMPFLGWSIAYALQLPTPFAVGLILVACCPGVAPLPTWSPISPGSRGALSSDDDVFHLWGHRHDAALTKWLAGTLVPVDAWALFLSTVQVVLLPVLAGLALHHFFPRDW